MSKKNLTTIAFTILHLLQYLMQYIGGKRNSEATTSQLLHIEFLETSQSNLRALPWIAIKEHKVNIIPYSSIYADM